MGRKVCPGSGLGSSCCSHQLAEAPGWKGGLGAMTGTPVKAWGHEPRPGTGRRLEQKVRERARSKPSVWCREPTSYLLTSQVVLVVKNLPASAGDTRDWGSIPGSGRSPGEDNGNPLQYSCLEDPMERKAWQATVHGVSKSQARLSAHTGTPSTTFSHLPAKPLLLLIHCYLTLFILSLVVLTGVQEHILRLFVTT